MKVQDWDEYIAEQQKLTQDSRGELQRLITESKIPLDELQLMAQIDLSVMDPELLQQLKLSTGVDLKAIQVEKPKNNASTYRMKGRAISI